MRTQHFQERIEKTFTGRGKWHWGNDNLVELKTTCYSLKKTGRSEKDQ